MEITLGSGRTDKRRMLTVISGLLLALFAVICQVSTVYASETAQATLDLDRQGSIVINTGHVSGETRNPVSGVEVSIYQIAAAGVENGQLIYVPSEGFEGSAEQLNSGLSGEDNSALAKVLAQTAGLEACRVGDAGITDADGNVRFDSLSCGMYLAVQTKAHSGYYTMDPFLIPVPMISENEGISLWLYEVTAMPKFERKTSGGGGHSGGGGGGGGGTTPGGPGTTTTTVTDGSTPGGGLDNDPALDELPTDGTPLALILARTGDNSNVLLLSVMSILSLLIFVVLAVRIARKKRK